MLRRLHQDQPETFAFAPANQAWAEAQMTKYPEGRQASAIIPLLWRAQEQEGWLTRPAIEHVAEMLGLAYIRALEVATFYFMFQLQPVGRVAHIQICGTTSCMICGAEDLVEVCKREIAARPHEISGDGQLSWEEVECLGACANAPMAQIGKDYYEDLSPERLTEMLAEFRAGGVPVPGSQTGRFASEPLGGATALTGPAENPDHERNASVALAVALGDTVKRIDGTEVPLTTPWTRAEQADPDPETADRDPNLGPAGPDGSQAGKVRGETDANRERGDASDGVANVRGSDEEGTGHPDEGDVAPAAHDGGRAASGGAAAGLAAREAAGHANSTEAEPAGRRGEEESEATDAPEAATGGAPATEATPLADRGTPAEARAEAPAKTRRARTDAGSEGAGTRPEGLEQPRGGKADDLKQIRGIGVRLESLLNSMGFWHFDQIADWSVDEIAWVDANLEGFRGRVTRDDWVGQAKLRTKGA